MGLWSSLLLGWKECKARVIKHAMNKDGGRQEGVEWEDIEYRNIGKKRLRVRKKKLVGSEQYQMFNNRGGNEGVGYTLANASRIYTASLMSHQ